MSEDKKDENIISSNDNEEKIEKMIINLQLMKNLMSLQLSLIII